MKTIAIALETKPREPLTLDQTKLLEEILMDKRLTKAEAIKAYTESLKYGSKKGAYQRYHAEFGMVDGIGIAEGVKVSSYSGEVESIEALGKAIAGAGRIVGFDLPWQLSFILRRCAITGEITSFSRNQLFTNFGTATTAMIDLKKAWTQSDREYSSLTLESLCFFMGMDLALKEVSPAIELKAARTMWLYDRMKGILL